MKLYGVYEGGEWEPPVLRYLCSIKENAEYIIKKLKVIDRYNEVHAKPFELEVDNFRDFEYVEGFLLIEDCVAFANHEMSLTDLDIDFHIVEIEKTSQEHDGYFYASVKFEYDINKMKAVVIEKYLEYKRS